MITDSDIIINNMISESVALHLLKEMTSLQKIVIFVSSTDPSVLL